MKPTVATLEMLYLACCKKNKEKEKRNVRRKWNAVCVCLDLVRDERERERERERESYFWTKARSQEPEIFLSNSLFIYLHVLR